MPSGTPQRKEWAEIIFEFIPASETDEWVTAKEIAEASGLTEKQVRAGIRYIKDIMADDALVASYRGYRWSVTADEVETYRALVGQKTDTTLRRLKTGTMIPFWKKTVRRADEREKKEREFDRAMESIKDLLI
jgi:hypothetical protein